MFTATIQFKGKEKLIKFSTWVTGEIEKLMKSDPGMIELFANMIYFGLIHGGDLRSKYVADESLGFDLFDCYDWIDEQGGLESDEVQRVQKLYTKQKEEGVPKNPKATKSVKK